MTRFVLAFSVACCVTAPLILAGCGSTPKTAEERDEKVAEARATLKTMVAKDASISKVLAGSYGHAVFTTIGSGALIIGGQGGGGIIFEGDRPWGSVTLAKGSIGLQAGGEAFSELIIFSTKESFDSFTAGEFSFTAEATATAIKADAAASAPVINGAKVLTMTKGGLMAAAAVGGQDFSCTPFDAVE
jgi:lipid-binding SYLF domain-containing protein